MFTPTFTGDITGVLLVTYYITNPTNPTKLSLFIYCKKKEYNTFLNFVIDSVLGSGGKTF